MTDRELFDAGYSIEFMHTYADAATAAKSERHAQEMAAYELTVSNLRAQLAVRGVPFCYIRHDNVYDMTTHPSGALDQMRMPLYAAPQPAAHSGKTDWARGFEAGIASNIDIAKAATGAMQKERAEHAEMNRMMTEALLQAEGLAATPQPHPAAQPELTDAEICDDAKRTETAEPGRDGYILPVSFARAIIAAHEAKRCAK